MANIFGVELPAMQAGTKALTSTMQGVVDYYEAERQSEMVGVETKLRKDQISKKQRWAVSDFLTERGGMGAVKLDQGSLRRSMRIVAGRTDIEFHRCVLVSCARRDFSDLIVAHQAKVGSASLGQLIESTVMTGIAAVLDYGMDIGRQEVLVPLTMRRMASCACEICERCPQV